MLLEKAVFEKLKKPVVGKQRAKGGLYEETLVSYRVVLGVAVGTPSRDKVNHQPSKPAEPIHENPVTTNQMIPTTTLPL